VTFRAALSGCVTSAARSASRQGESARRIELELHLSELERRRGVHGLHRRLLGERDGREGVRHGIEGIAAEGMRLRHGELDRGARASEPTRLAQRARLLEVSRLADRLKVLTLLDEEFELSGPGHVRGAVLSGHLLLLEREELRGAPLLAT
jgi:hypothetical protein